MSRFVALGRLCGVLALLCVFLTPGLAGALGTPAGTVVCNWASVVWEDINGNPYGPVYSDTVCVVVLQVANFIVLPGMPTVQSACAGETLSFCHRLLNLGNGIDSVRLSSSRTQTWPAIRIFRTHGDSCAPVPGDTLLLPSAVLHLGLNETLRLRIEVPIPTTGVLFTQDSLQIIFTSFVDTVLVDSAMDISILDGALIMPHHFWLDPRGAEVNLAHWGDSVWSSYILANEGGDSVCSVGITLAIPDSFSIINLPMAMDTTQYRILLYRDGIGWTTDLAQLHLADSIRVNRVRCLPVGGTDTMAFLHQFTGCLQGAWLVLPQRLEYSNYCTGTLISNLWPDSLRTESFRVTFSPGTRYILTALDTIAYAPHWISNEGPPLDSIQLAVTTVHGWAWQAFIDSNCNGVLDSSELALRDTLPFRLATGARRCWVIRFRTRSDSLRSTQEIATPTVQSLDNPCIRLWATDTFYMNRPIVTLDLVHLGGFDTAGVCTLSLEITNSGGRGPVNMTLSDTIPDPFCFIWDDPWNFLLPGVALDSTTYTYDTTATPGYEIVDTRRSPVELWPTSHSGMAECRLKIVRWHLSGTIGEAAEGHGYIRFRVKYR